jgi:thioredoxin 1
MAKPEAITDDNFEKTIADSDTPVLVDFWAEWCPPCHMIAPVLEAIASEYDGKIKITKLDVDYNPRTAQQFGVQSIPTMIVFKGGKAVDRLVGFMPKARLLEKLTPHMS